MPYILLTRFIFIMSWSDWVPLNYSGTLPRIGWT
jgi:hypothetical protein